MRRRTNNLESSNESHNFLKHLQTPTGTRYETRPEGWKREKKHKLNKARHCSANSRHAKVVAGVHDALFAVCALPKNMLDVDPI